MTRMERRKILSEEKHRVKMKKVKKHWVTVGMTTIVGLGVIGLSEGVEASADTWKPTSLEEMKTRVKLEDGKYTFQSGDTFWAIGNAINIKPEKLMELNNFAPGTQYSVPIGTTIYWSGDNVKVVDQTGNVIAQETIQSEDKINPNALVGSSTSNNQNGSNVTGNQNSPSSNTSTNNGGSTAKGNEENKGSNNGNSSNGTVIPTPNPSNPELPVNPVDPTEPEKPTQSELEKLKAKLAELKAQLAVAKQELAQAEQELANAKSDTSKSELEAKINEQQTIIDNAQATISSKQADIASLESQISVANTDLTTAQNNLATANTALSTAQSNTATAQQAFDAANTALLADPSDPVLQQAVNDTQSALNNAQQQETQAVNNQASAQTAVNTAQSTIDSLNSSKQQATNELSTAQNTLTTAQNEKANLEQQLNNAGNNNIADLEAKVKEKQKVVADLEAEIKKVEEQISKLEGQEKPKPPVVVEVDKSALSNLVNSVKNTDLSKYTDDTVSAFTNALTQANSVLNNAKATQNEVNTALSNLQSAFNNLAEKIEENKVDKSALQELINSVKDIDLSVYTDESVEKFNTALSTANTVLNNEKATQSQVDSAKSALQNAYDSLNFKPIETVNKNELSNLLDVLSKADLSKYTTDSVEKFNEALSNAYNVFWNNEATQSQVDSAVSALEKAYDNLVEKEDPTPTPVVDKTQLNLVVSEASSIHLDDYTTDSAKALSTALSKAKEVLSNAKATQEQVNNAKDNLRNAIDNLVEKPEEIKVDKTALQSAVDSVSSLKQADYTSTSWSKLQTALTNAKAVLDNKDATQSQVDAQVTALNNAKSALVKKADKKALDQAIAKVPATQGSYTDASWKALQSALSTAKTISGKEDATQSEVDSATTALNKAINDLKVQKYTLTVIHKDESGKVLDTEEFEVEKGKNYQAKAKGIDGYELVGEGTKTVTNMQADGTVIFTYKKKVTEDEKIKETQDTVNKGAIDIWNDYREANGKTQAYENEILQKMADQRAKELVEIYDASHTRPNGYDIFGYNEKTGQWGESLAEEFGYYNVEGMGVKRTVVGENIAKIEGVSLEWIQEHGATYVMEAWKASPAHNNMLLVSSANNPINQYGIGSYITKNSDGTYNVYYVALVGYDKNLK